MCETDLYWMGLKTEWYVNSYDDVDIFSTNLSIMISKICKKYKKISKKMQKILQKNYKKIPKKIPKKLHQKFAKICENLEKFGKIWNSLVLGGALGNGLKKLLLHSVEIIVFFTA